MSNTPSDRFRARILEVFPAHAARNGWTDAAFKAAVAEAGLSKAERAQLDAAAALMLRLGNAD